MTHLKEKILKYKSAIGLVLLCLLLSVITPTFLSVSNILNVLTQISVNAIIAMGMSFVIITGGIDLSVGSILAITGAVAAYLIKTTDNLFVSIVVAIIIGSLIGFLNGFIIAERKVQPFIATLATMTIFRGVTYVFTNGTPISGLGETFGFLGNGKVVGIPFPVIVMLIIFFIGAYILNETRFGRYVYAIGGNEDTARLSGINTNYIKTLVYFISGMMAAISGILVASRIDSATPTAGTGYELDAIAAVVLGGTSLSGGEGTIIGTLIGAMIIGVINNGLNLLNVSPFYQAIVKGIIILIAVLADKKGQ